MKHKLESRFPGEILITPDVQMTPPLWQKVKKPGSSVHGIFQARVLEWGAIAFHSFWIEQSIAFRAALWSGDGVG